VVSAPALGDVLDECVTFMDRFMQMSEHQLDAVALFVAQSHAVDQFDVCPYLFVTSPAKRCGKSLLLDLCEAVVRTGRSTANISPAALYRMLDEVHPTLLFDEVDNIFTKGGKADPARAELTGLINAGFRKGRPAYRMGGANMRQLEEFDAFGPKILAGIGSCLPDTTMDRCIPIVLERKPKSVIKERYRLRIHEEEAHALRDRIADAVSVHQDLGRRWPALPPELSDRAQDIWEPLLALADAAGGTWPQRARAAAVALHRQQDDDGNVAGRLLEDIRAIFRPADEHGVGLPHVEKMLTKDLVVRLNTMDESPWADWRGGNGITSANVAKILKSYGVTSEHMRVGADRGRGFTIDQLDPLFSRYLAVDRVDTDDNGPNPQVSHVNESVNTAALASVDGTVDAPDQDVPAIVNDVNTVTDEAPGSEPVDFDGALIGGAP
jgi:hypothetical protein